MTLKVWYPYIKIFTVMIPFAQEVGDFLFNRFIQKVDRGSFQTCRLNRNLCKGRFGNWGEMLILVAGEMKAVELSFSLLFSILPHLPFPDGFQLRVSAIPW